MAYILYLDMTETEPRALYTAIFDQLLKRQLVSIGDLVILTRRANCPV